MYVKDPTKARNGKNLVGMDYSLTQIFAQHRLLKISVIYLKVEIKKGSNTTIAKYFQKTNAFTFLKHAFQR